MLSKNQLKLILSLKKKKFRQQHKLFLAEGIKVVEELLTSKFEIQQLFCTSSYINRFNVEKPQLISEKELHNISTFNSPNQLLGIFKIPKNEIIKTKGFTLVLDEINDPGNLGTIIRLCDWFAVDQLICSTDTVDRYNQKVVQASMGSLARLSIVYTDIKKFIESENRFVYGALLQGENIYKNKLTKNAILVMGNEANGISPNIQNLIKQPITIPQFGAEQNTESLNVASATAILLSEFNR
jgi:TrmH family RNA methyltransferase